MKNFGQVTLSQVEKAMRDLGSKGTWPEILKQLTTNRHDDWSYYRDWTSYETTAFQIIQEHCPRYKKYKGPTHFESVEKEFQILKTSSGLSGDLGRAAGAKAQEDLLEDAYVRFSLAQRRVIVRRHNRLSNRFRKWLREVGAKTIKAESRQVDISCFASGQRCLFELKICYNQTPRHALREALGQVLEYAFFPGRAAYDALAVVLDGQPGDAEILWLRRLEESGVSVELFWLRGETVFSPRLTNHPLAKYAKEARIAV